MEIELIGVPFNSGGLDDVVARGNVAAARMRPERSPRSGLLAPDALVSMVAGVHRTVSAAYAQGRFPVVAGATAPFCCGSELPPTLKAAGGRARVPIPVPLTGRGDGRAGDEGAVEPVRRRHGAEGVRRLAAAAALGSHGGGLRGAGGRLPALARGLGASRRGPVGGVGPRLGRAGLQAGR